MIAFSIAAPNSGATSLPMPRIPTEPNQIFPEHFAGLARRRIDAAFRHAKAASAPALPSLYAAFNRAAADLIDDLHETAAQKNIGEPLLVAKAERSIVAACSGRAAELLAKSDKPGGAA